MHSPRVEGHVLLTTLCVLPLHTGSYLRAAAVVTGVSSAHHGSQGMLEAACPEHCRPGCSSGSTQASLRTTATPGAPSCPGCCRAHAASPAAGVQPVAVLARVGETDCELAWARLFGPISHSVLVSPGRCLQSAGCVRRLRVERTGKP